MAKTGVNGARAREAQPDVFISTLAPEGVKPPARASPGDSARHAHARTDEWGNIMLSGRCVSRADHDVRQRQWMDKDREGLRNRPMGVGSALCWLRASANGTIRLWESIYVQADKDLNGGCLVDARAALLFD